MHNDKTNCYKCKFKRSVPGDCHISCASPDPNMTGDPHGIRNGWFLYPWVFDPVWKTRDCNTYRQIDKVFLGGTCAGSIWREELIKALNIKYFNPVVEDWTPKCQEIEIKEKEEGCNIHLYVITKQMSGVFSIAEAVDSVHNKDKVTVFQVMPEGFDVGQLKSLQATVDLIKSRGGISFINDSLDSTAKLLNSEWPIAGFAPGSYSNTCCDCNEEFLGDKRAIRCLHCALTPIKEG